MRQALITAAVTGAVAAGFLAAAAAVELPLVATIAGALLTIAAARTITPAWRLERGRDDR